MRNNLLNRNRFLFPPFEFIGFKDDITVKGREASWKLFHDVHEKDLTLDADLHKAPKLSKCYKQENLSKMLKLLLTCLMKVK